MGASTPAFSNAFGPISAVSPAADPYTSPYWRFVITDLDGEALTMLSHLASDREIQYLLNAPARATFKVPSDNPQVNIPGDDGYPFVAEGVRCLLGFRKEAGVWVIRYTGLLLQVQDTAEQDIAYTHVTSYDPWQYLMYRPVVNYTTGKIPGPKGISWNDTVGSTIALQVLRNTITWRGSCFIDAGVAWGGTSFYTGTIETTNDLDINFPQGTSVGEAWQQLCATDTMDIVLEPIYDPVNRPGYLAQVSIYGQAGSNRDGATFAWDKPGRSLVQLDRLDDGTIRANKVAYYTGQGGPPVAIQTNAPSVSTFGEYWAVQWFPGQNIPAAVVYLAQEILSLRKTGQRTVEISPAPERSPEPFLDYYLGDRVPVYASSDFREAISGYQRIYGIPIALSDDATEQISHLITSEQT